MEEIKINTLEELGEYSISGLTDLFNKNASEIVFESTGASYVKKKIEDKLISLFGGKFEVRSGWVDSRSITISHPNMFFGITFKLSAKNTEKTVQLTKLKSAYVKVPGKVKFDNIYFRFSMPCYEYDEKTKKGRLDSGTTSGESTCLNSKEFGINTKISEINTKEYCMSLVKKSMEKEKSVEDYILTNAFQPWIKRLPWMHEKLIQEEMSPYAEKYNIDKGDALWTWNAALREYKENNPNMVQETLNWIVNYAFCKYN